MDSPGARCTEISVLVSGFVLRASATLGVTTDNTPTANTPVNTIETNFLFITYPPTIYKAFTNNKSHPYTRITISSCYIQQHTKHT